MKIKNYIEELEVPENVQGLIKEIKFPDGGVAFRIIEVK